MLSPGLLYEEKRLQALQRYDILDTPAESAYDDVVLMAARLCDVPVAVISLVDRDRQWFKANVGLPGVQQTERCISFCTFAIEEARLFVVEDTHLDTRFATNPLVIEAPYARFYAGVPIESEDGFLLGTLCVLDFKPRTLSDVQRRDLCALKRQVELLLRMRLQVRQTEARNRQLLECSGEAVFLLDEQGLVVEANPVAERLLRREGSQLLGTPLEALCPEREREPLRRSLWELLSRGSARLENQGFLSARGERVALDLTASLQEVGSSARMLVVGRDCTEKRRMEQQGLQNDRLASMGALAAGIAHEINNPIGYVLTNLGYLRDCREDFERTIAQVPELARKLKPQLDEAREALTESIEGCTRIRDIVRDMRSFAHAPDESTAPVDINASLDFVLRMAHSELKSTALLQKDYDLSLPAVFGNESRLSQVFLNLVINALQAMHAGDPEQNVLRVRTACEGDRVRVDVSDTGHGISPEVLPRIFDPFFTTKPAGMGTGLGLSISHSLVQKMGGELSVRSAPGQGTTFSLLLPTVAHAAEPHALAS